MVRITKFDMTSPLLESKREFDEESCHSSDVSDEEEEDSEEQFDAARSQRPTYHSQSQRSCDFEEFAKHDFSLSNEELEKCLGILHKANRLTPFKKNCLTHTSHWSRKSLTASAAYKIFKVKRWFLKDVSVIFDPFDEDAFPYANVERSSILWPDPQVEHADDEFAILKHLSVDGLLARNCHGVALENLKKLDEALKDFNHDTPTVYNTEDSVQDLLEHLIDTGIEILPGILREPFSDFVFILTHAINVCATRDKADEQFFQNMFERLFRCVMVCIEEQERVKVSPTLDGRNLDKMELIPASKSCEKSLIVSSRPDLFIYERGADFLTKRIIAVVEVKGKARDQVLHCDDEDEEEPPSLGVIDEESDEELPVLEKLKTRKKRYMKRLDGDSRRYIRRFLPQLVGEMLCCSVRNAEHGIGINNFGSTLGIAVVGFDVYFVTMVSRRETVLEMLMDSGSYTDVFITQPFNLCKRRDRQIIFKVLSAACYIKTPLLSLCNCK